MRRRARNWSSTGGSFGDDAPAERLTLPNLRIIGKSWLDGINRIVPRWHSHLYALQPARSEAEWDEFDAYLVDTGFTGKRTFAGELAQVSQTADGARQRLDRFLTLASDKGLAVEVVALTGTRAGTYDIERHVREICAMLIGRANVVLELGNEFTHPSQSLTREQLIDLGRRFAEPAGIVWAVGAPDVDEPDEDDKFAGAGGSYAVAHLDRGRDFWNQARRVREIAAVVEAIGAPTLNNEPLGADERDGSQSGKQRSNDPAFFATLGALDRAFPGVGGVHHSQAGLDAVLPGPVQLACAEAYVAAQGAVDSVLGQDVGQYRNSNGGDSPVGKYSDQDWERKITRHYSFVVGNRGVSIALGMADGLAVPWANGWRPSNELHRVTAKDGKSLVIWSVVR